MSPEVDAYCVHAGCDKLAFRPQDSNLGLIEIESGGGLYALSQRTTVPMSLLEDDAKETLLERLAYLRPPGPSSRRSAGSLRLFFHVEGYGFNQDTTPLQSVPFTRPGFLRLMHCLTLPPSYPSDLASRKGLAPQITDLYSQSGPVVGQCTRYEDRKPSD